jgi:hypothetical protein
MLNSISIISSIRASLCESASSALLAHQGPLLKNNKFANSC